jgi:hypothetical protein
LTKRFFAHALVLLALCAPSAEALAQEKPVSIRLSGISGFDNNVNLDSTRKGDFFFQETVSVGYRKLLTPAHNFRLSYDAANLNYSDFTDQNFLAQTFGTGLDVLLTEKTILETQYSYTYAWYPSNRSVTYDEHFVRAGLRYKWSRDVQLKAGVGAAQQEFDDRKLRQAEGLLSEDAERKDKRGFADAEIGMKLFGKSYWRLGYAYVRNDSNDAFHDYYDYDAHRFSVSASLQVIPKVATFVKVTYEDRGYDSRPLLLDDGTLESDGIYTTSLACFYNLRKDLALGAILSYRQKESNEPTQRYSGSLYTLGLYYSF